MFMDRLTVFLLTFLLVGQVSLSVNFQITQVAQAQTVPDVFVGVDIAYGGETEAKTLIDQVSSFTNFFMIGTLKVSNDGTALNETIQYAYVHGLFVSSLLPSLSGDDNPAGFYQFANSAWGNRLIGFYVGDEPGGKQLDSNSELLRATNFTDDAAQYEKNLGSSIYRSILWQRNYLLCTSDYGLYWFDYKAGYDLIFAEFVGNSNRQMVASLARGAATVQNKDWGVMLYVESGDALYNDMLLAYDNGAKYIVIFDSNGAYSQGVLGTDQLQAMQRFWNHIQANPRNSVPTGERTAYVLPNSYGFGFRNVGDTIWGVWLPDELTSTIWSSANALVNEYGSSLDIIYDDGLEPGNNGYSQLIRWDSYFPPNPTPTPQPTQSPSSTSSPQPTQPGFLDTNLPIEYGYAIVATIVIIAVASISLVYFKRLKNR
jgi:hypothetical protein